MNKITISNLIDYPAIQEIAYKTWPVTFGDILSTTQIDYMLDMMYSTDSLKEQIEKKGHQFLIAKEGYVNLGFASYELDYRGELKTKIHKIYILPEQQGKGIGKQMINAIKEVAKRKHNTFISLNVNKNNKAIEFYKSIGFEKVGEEDIDIGNGFLMEDFIMELEIK